MTDLIFRPEEYALSEMRWHRRCGDEEAAERAMKLIKVKYEVLELVLISISKDNAV